MLIFVMPARGSLCFCSLTDILLFLPLCICFPAYVNVRSFISHSHKLDFIVVASLHGRGLFRRFSSLLSDFRVCFLPCLRSFLRKLELCSPLKSHSTSDQTRLRRSQDHQCQIRIFLEFSRLWRLGRGLGICDAE